MRRFFYFSLITLAPLLMSAVCSLRVPTQDEPERIVVRGLLDDIINDVLIVTPFATLTPTPTLTPTLSGQSQGASVEGGSGNGDGDGNGNGGQDENGGGPPIVGNRPTVIPLPTATIFQLPSPTLPLPTLTLIPTNTPPPTPVPIPTSTPIPPTPVPPPPDPSDDDDDDDDNNIPSPPTATPLPTSTFTPTPLPVVSFAQSTYSVNEEEANGLITVILDQPASRSVTVSYTTTDISAFAPNDYIPTNGSLTFPTGEITKTFNVPIVNDNVDDPDIEEVGLSLSNPQNATLGTSTAVLEITDDDPLPLIEFAETFYFVDEPDIPELTITLDRPSGKTINFTYGPTSGGTATNPDDYLIVFNVKSLAPDITGVGPISTTVIWDGIVDDTIGELPLDETVIIELSGLSNVDFGSLITTTIEISDNDPQ